MLFHLLISIVKFSALKFSPAECHTYSIYAGAGLIVEYKVSLFWTDESEQEIINNEVKRVTDNFFI